VGKVGAPGGGFTGGRGGAGKKAAKERGGEGEQIGRNTLTHHGHMCVCMPCCKAQEVHTVSIDGVLHMCCAPQHVRCAIVCAVLCPTHVLRCAA
jgi:hypothetical protein